MVAEMTPLRIQSSVSGSVSMATTILFLTPLLLSTVATSLPASASETDEGVDLIFFFPQDLGGGVESDARVALDVDDTRDLDLWMRFERVAVAAEALSHVGLLGHGEGDDIAFPFEFRREALACPSARPGSCWCR